MEVGDTALLAFGYSRAFLIAPSEEIYHKITEATQSVQWIHPDIFASMLSFSGHPSPQKNTITTNRHTNPASQDYPSRLDSTSTDASIP